MNPRWRACFEPKKNLIAHFEIAKKKREIARWPHRKALEPVVDEIDRGRIARAQHRALLI